MMRVYTENAETKKYLLKKLNVDKLDPPLIHWPDFRMNSQKYFAVCKKGARF